VPFAKPVNLLPNAKKKLNAYSFHARGAQKRKKDSQVASLFMLLGSTSVKAERKYVGEIEPGSRFVG
jgi:hypothetical protein